MVGWALATSVMWPLLAVQPARADDMYFPPPSTALGTCTPAIAAAGYTNCTVSTHHETHTDRTDLPDVDTFSTRVLGTAVVTGPGIFQSVTAFDQSTPSPFGSAAVDSLFTQAAAAARAETIALAAGRPFIALPVSGPTQTASSVSSTTALVSHTLEQPFGPLSGPACLYDVCMVLPPDTSTYTITNSREIGPGTYYTGVEGSVAVFWPAGTDGLNTNFEFASDYLDTYQTTNSHSAAYEITETILVQLIGTIHPAVQTAALDSGSDFLHRLGGAAASVDTDAGDPAAWGEGYGLWSHAGAQGMVPGNQVSTGGLAGGIGFAVAPGLSLGFGVDHGWTGIDERSVFEHADLELTQFGVNAAYAGGGWTLAAAIVGGTGNVDASHGSAALGGVSTASYHVTTWGAQGEAGFRVRLGGWTLTPKLGFDWTSVHSAGFAESGGLALDAAGHTISRTRGWLGLTAAGGFGAVAHRLDVSVTARAIAVLAGRARSLPVEYAGTALRVDGLTEGRYAADLEARAALAVATNARLFVSGEGEWGGHGDHALAGRAGLEISF